MKDWKALPSVDKRNHILRILNENPEATGEEIKELLGLPETENSLPVTLTVMRKRGEIRRKKNSHPARWTALVERSVEQRRASRAKGRHGEGRTLVAQDNMCDPPYGSLPYERRLEAAYTVTRFTKTAS